MSAEPTGAHGVPKGQADRTEETLASTSDLRREPTDAERSRTLTAYTRHAALSTLSAGHPFGSLVGYAVDGSGRPILCLSDMAEHTGNLLTDPRASLMVVATCPAGGDPLARARATLVGDLVAVAPAEQEDVRRTYVTTHPEAFYSEFADFRCYRLGITAVRYVGGFGRMSWVETVEYRAAEPDPLHPHADGIIEHMNADHADALVSFCRVLGSCPGTGWAEMVHVDRYGFDVLAATARGQAAQAVRIGFDDLTDSPQATRAAMITLLTRVRFQEAGPA